jgi:hypothetical protein
MKLALSWQAAQRLGRNQKIGQSLIRQRRRSHRDIISSVMDILDPRSSIFICFQKRGKGYNLMQQVSDNICR